MGQTLDDTLLVFNCHEAWVHQLGVLGFKLDIIVGLKGQFKGSWDHQMRPVPSNSRLVSSAEALASSTRYHCVIAHNIADLLEIKTRREPKLIVIHSTMEGRLLEERTSVNPRQVREMLAQYLDIIGGHAVAVSRLKGASWGFTDDVVPFFADPSEYPPYSGELACGLRICNFVNNRRGILLWDLHTRAFGDLPIRLVGHNPDMPSVSAAENWAELKSTLQSHRFYIHTADPHLEDGYNMATLEAMAAGMPVIGNVHPGSPVKHGVSGFLSDDPAELRGYAQMLLNDRELAAKMGQEARKTVIERFSPGQFRSGFLRSIEQARRKAGANAGAGPGFDGNVPVIAAPDYCGAGSNGQPKYGR